ncbi:glutathione peroxidase [Bacteroidia bacterium]|nr:glutathione peroxidase [Bacteroidia bacterium]
MSLVLAQCSTQSKTEQAQESNNTAKGEITSSNSSDVIAIKNFHYFTIPTLDEQSTLKMSDYKGKKILIVNVASKCGFTPQYEGLQKLNELHGDKVQIIGFPCNQFLGQEPGGKEEIAAFCQKNYGVTFPITTKIDVKGSSQNEIYTWLTNKETNELEEYKVTWNFNKFLVDENGKFIKYYGSKVEPMGKELLADILK